MSRKNLPEKASVVVVGGGIIGASILYHLARDGIDAVLIERRKLASGTTWHAAGIVGQLRESKAQTELAQYTTRLFQSLEEETGQATGYKQSGSISVALNPVRLELIRRNLSHAQRMGVEARFLKPDDLQQLWPLVSLEGVLGASFVPSNGQVNPLDVTQALVKGARSRGAKIFEDTKVTKVVVRDGKVAAVETDNGTVTCDSVVVAGGMWTHKLAKELGIAVPLQAAEHFYLVTENVPGLPPTLPIMTVADERSYWKEDAGKLLIGGFEARGKAWAPTEGIPDDFEFSSLPFDMEHVEPLLELAYARVPKLADLGIQLFFCGPESFTPDGRAILGPVAEVRGLHVATGMNSNGILNSGGVGKIVAGWVAKGMPEKSMLSMHVRRFMPFQSNDAYVKERVVESIGMHMTLHWPGHHVETARGIRRLPLHDRLKAAGAVFGERVGWETPMWFGEPGAEWPKEPSIGYQQWFGAVEAECLAARDAVAFCDMSMYAKIGVHGTDAVNLLNRLASAEIDVPVGSSVYTPFLNERGGIEADVTIVRLAEDRFIVLSGHPQQVRDAALLRDGVEPGEYVVIVDETSAYALLSLHGPKSRELLQSLSADDLSAEGFAFGKSKTIDVALARPIVIRRSFFGELGFELLVPTEFSYHVYEALVDAGQKLGLRHAGLLAMNHCRMEKGFRHFGHDIAEEDTPIEAGLGFAIAWDKKAPFAGRKALEAQRPKAASPVFRLVQVALVNARLADGPFLIHNEPIWLHDRIVGHVTSGAWGFRVDRSLGIASLNNPEGVTKEWIAKNEFEVEIAGVRHPIEVNLGGFYDPTGARMRG
jgi:4-methylaminobutanoate oxidase (formaldehyde-forming)